MVRIDPTRQTLGHPNQSLFFDPRQNAVLLSHMSWIDACHDAASIPQRPPQRAPVGKCAPTLPIPYPKLNYCAKRTYSRCRRGFILLRRMVSPTVEGHSGSNSRRRMREKRLSWPSTRLDVVDFQSLRLHTSKVIRICGSGERRRTQSSRFGSREGRLESIGPNPESQAHGDWNLAPVLAKGA